MGPVYAMLAITVGLVSAFAAFIYGKRYYIMVPSVREEQRRAGANVADINNQVRVVTEGLLRKWWRQLKDWWRTDDAKSVWKIAKVFAILICTLILYLFDWD